MRHKVAPWVLPHQRSPVKGPCRRLQYYPMRWGQRAYRLGVKGGGSALATAWHWSFMFGALKAEEKS